MGVDADPLTSREHILLSTLIEHAWAQGESLDLPALVAAVTQPPFRKMGVFDLEHVFPEDARMQFALRLNGLLAAPGFAAWLAQRSSTASTRSMPSAITEATKSSSPPSSKGRARRLPWAGLPPITCG